MEIPSAWGVDMLQLGSTLEITILEQVTAFNLGINTTILYLTRRFSFGPLRVGGWAKKELCTKPGRSDHPSLQHWRRAPPRAALACFPPSSCDCEPVARSSAEQSCRLQSLLCLCSSPRMGAPYLNNRLRGASSSWLSGLPL